MEWGKGWGGVGRVRQVLGHGQGFGSCLPCTDHARLSPCLPSIEGSTRHGRQRRGRELDVIYLAGRSQCVRAKLPSASSAPRVTPSGGSSWASWLAMTSPAPAPAPAASAPAPAAPSRRYHSICIKRPLPPQGLCSLQLIECCIGY